MKPSSSATPRVVVIGAGLSGLVCARALVEQGWAVKILDKGRRPGGRACSRCEGDVVFDHGAQFFTARDEWLARHVVGWEVDGIVARWTPRLVQTRGARPRDATPWWVGTPSMGALANHLARGLDIEQSCRVTALARAADGSWSLRRSIGDREELPPLAADAVVVALPSAQAASLLAEAHPSFAQIAKSVEHAPCWAVMVSVCGAADLAADVFEDGEGPIAWAARQESKPGRSNRSTKEAQHWVLHGSVPWTKEHLEDTPAEVAARLSEAFVEQCSLGGRAEIMHASAHRWRYARGHLSQQAPALFDAKARLGVCGDWLSGARIEGALTSGRAVGGCLLASVDA